MKKHYLCIRFCERAKFLAKWCNGSTTDSGSVCLGSSPSLATKKKDSRLRVFLFFVELMEENPSKGGPRNFQFVGRVRICDCLISLCDSHCNEHNPNDES